MREKEREGKTDTKRRNEHTLFSNGKELFAHTPFDILPFISQFSFMRERGGGEDEETKREEEGAGSERMVVGKPCKKGSSQDIIPVPLLFPVSRVCSEGF